MARRAITLMLGTAVLAAAPSAGASSPCRPAGARTLAADSLARVYVFGGDVYGCALRPGRPRLLGVTAGRTRVGQLALAGVVVAYARIAMAVDTSSSTVQVIDLARGRTLRSLAATTPATRPESFSNVTAVVVRPDGAVGWIAEKSGIGQLASYEVHRAGGRGSALLDSGQGIAPHSLRLSGDTLSWTDRGQRRSAPLG